MHIHIVLLNGTREKGPLFYLPPMYPRHFDRGFFLVFEAKMIIFQRFGFNNLGKKISVS